MLKNKTIEMGVSCIIGSVIILMQAISTHGYSWDEPTALDEYVNRDDGMWNYRVLDSYRFDNDSCTVYILNMTSQRWMDETFSSQPIWWHFMGVAIPDEPRRDFAYLFIDGGGNNPDRLPPDPEDERVSLVRNVARLSGYFASFILQVPNQGVTFANDPDQVSRTEDKFIAWTWKTFTDNPGMYPPEIIARLPMTKAGKRGLDTVRDFVLNMLPGHDITQFAVGGGSKRGWTSWSLAAADRRVIAVTPMVMSLLNFDKTLQAHYRNLGGWTWVFNDYWELNLTQRFQDDVVSNWEYGLWTYEDMFRYKERLELIPKLMISATGDEFFLPTDSHNWWNEMGGAKWIMMNQNAEHSLVPWYQKIGESVTAWLMLHLEPTLPTIPHLTWIRGSTDTGARILLNVDTVPDEITAWVAYNYENDTRKDFRWVTGEPPYYHFVIWHRENVTTIGPGTYDVEIEQRPPRWGGVFIDCVWTRLVPGLKLHLTTEVQVTPDTYPYPPCEGAGCWGTLV